MSPTSLERGRALEQQVARYFGAHGYQVRTNVVLTGRSGGRHEIDVLAERSDALTTVRIAIECKAWGNPIEKDVVSKLHYVMGDAGIHKGIVVSLAGTRSGADAAAASLGIDLWGPDELRHHLGADVFAAVDSAAGPSAAHVGRLVHGWPFLSDAGKAQAAAAATGKGRLGLRSLETMVWFAPMWVPAHLVHMTIAQPSTSRLRQRVTSAPLANLYDALEGRFLSRAARPPVELPTEQVPVIKPLRTESKVGAMLGKAVADRLKVTSAAAVSRHDANLLTLGIPSPIHNISVDHVSLVYLPVYAALLRRDADRFVAIDARSGQIDEHLSALLTSQVTHIRGGFTS